MPEAAPGSFNLRMGALAPSFSDQLTQQGVPFDARECEKWDRWHDALNTLAIGGPVTDGERQKIQQRLFKTIHKSLQRHIDSLAEKAQAALTAS